MNTYYVRHTAKMDVDAATRDHLWNGQLVGIHFPQRLPPTPDAGPDNDSLNPTDYPQPARSAMSVFARMSEAGGYVLAEYFGHPGCLVGVIERGTPLSLYRGKWGNRWGRSGQEAVLKTLQLSQVKIVTEVNAAKLLVGRPRQGTAMQWHSARQMIKNFLLGVTTPPSIRDLLPAFQEVMCSEFLRLPTEATGLPRMASLVLPVGRTLRGVDIYGLDSEGRIIAGQVTFQPSSRCPAKAPCLSVLKASMCIGSFFVRTKFRNSKMAFSFTR
jgi:hypothetical protein